MKHDPHGPARTRGRLASLVVAALLAAAALIGAAAAPASAAHIVRGSTYCLGYSVKRCAYIEAYRMNGRVEIRAGARMVNNWPQQYRIKIDHVSLYRGDHRITTRYSRRVVEHSTTVTTKGTARHGYYHALAKVCWRDILIGDGHFHCRWIQSHTVHFG